MISRRKAFWGCCRHFFGKSYGNLYRNMRRNDDRFYDSVVLDFEDYVEKWPNTPEATIHFERRAKNANR